MSESANTAVPSALGRGGLQNLLRHLREIRHRGAGAGRSFDPTTTEEDCSSAVLTSYSSIGEDGGRNTTLGEKTATPVGNDETKSTPAVDEFDFSFKPIEMDSISPYDAGYQTIMAVDEDRPIELNVDQSATDLEFKIIRQLEYYFGDYNLPKDKFMRELMELEDGWISMSTMLTFPRLSALSRDPVIIMNAIEKSSNKIVQVDRETVKDGIVGRIRRHPSKPLPEFNDARRLVLQERTVYVTGFPREGVTLDDLIDFFENNFEQVIGVRMRTARHSEGETASSSPPEFYGSVFVTFGTRQAAQTFIRDYGDDLQFGRKKLFVKWQKDYFNEKSEDSDSFRPEIIDRTVFVSGFDRMDTDQGELVSFFGQFDGSESAQKRIFRDRKEDPWKFTGSVFVTFEDREKAEQFLALPEVSYNGDKLRRKWQLQFFEDRGKFSRETRKWKESNPDCN